MLLETYSHPQPIETREAPGFGGDTPPWAPACLAQFPKDAIVEWVGDHHSPEDWSPSGPPSAHQHVLRIHAATCWGGRLHDLAVSQLAGYAQAALRHGFTGFSIFGESSPFHANAELNYLAFADFGSEANPEADLDSFLDRVAAPLLGDNGRARRYVELASRVASPPEAAAGAQCARRIAGELDGRPAERWGLAGELAGLLRVPELSARCSHVSPLVRSVIYSCQECKIMRRVIWLAAVGLAWGLLAGAGRAATVQMIVPFSRL